MPLNTFPDDFYDYDEQRKSLEGRRNGWRFVVGMHVRVKVTEVTPVSGGILVEWVEGGCKARHSRPEITKITQKNMAATHRQHARARTKSANGRNAAGRGKRSKRKRR